MESPMSCKACKREKPVVARGLCNACYQRWRKTGTTEYQRKGKQSQCQIKDCGARAISYGLCDRHRKRLERHGHTEDTRPDSWGAKEGHPLYHTWAWMKRQRLQQEISPEWVDDFLQFIADIGERPSSKHKLFAADETKPLGPANFVWKRAITEKVPGEDYKTYQNRVQKVYRSVRREAFSGYELKCRFGITAEDYGRMLIKQGGACAICKQPEGTVIRDKTISLAVDHCHDTGKIRGLLCAKCNQGLGCFSDDLTRLAAAITYLSKFT